MKTIDLRSKTKQPPMVGIGTWKDYSDQLIYSTDSITDNITEMTRRTTYKTKRYVGRLERVSDWMTGLYPPTEGYKIALFKVYRGYYPITVTETIVACGYCHKELTEFGYHEANKQCTRRKCTVGKRNLEELNEVYYDKKRKQRLI